MRGGCRKLRTAEVQTAYSAPNAVTVIKLRKMRWAGHAVRMEGHFMANPLRHRLGDRITLRWIVGERMGGLRALEPSCSR
jgi:hypothetical protein